MRIHEFKTMIDFLKDNGYDIYNMTMKEALECWKKS